MTMSGDPAGGTAGQTGTMQMQEGDDFVCSNCGCEIRLRHHGDPAKMTSMQPFTCCCGTQMQPENNQRTSGAQG